MWTSIHSMRETISGREIAKGPGRRFLRPIYMGVGEICQGGGVKQDTVADKTGLSQQKISKIEQSEDVNAEELEKIAEALGVTPEAIQSFDEEKVVYNIQNNHDTSNRGASNFIGTNNYSCTFNALDKLMEVIDENKRLYEELLKAMKEKNELLQKRLDDKK